MSAGDDDARTSRADALVAAMSIAYGLLVSTLLLPRRVTAVAATSAPRRAPPDDEPPPR